MEYKQLSKEFKRKGLWYKQVWRDKEYALYSVGLSENIVTGYEVFQIQKHEGYEIGGFKIEPSESYASGSSFGSTSYYCQTKERADIRLKELKASKKQKQNDHRRKEIS